MATNPMFAHKSKTQARWDRLRMAVDHNRAKALARSSTQSGNRAAFAPTGLSVDTSPHSGAGAASPRHKRRGSKGGSPKLLQGDERSHSPNGNGWRSMRRGSSGGSSGGEPHSPNGNGSGWPSRRRRRSSMFGVRETKSSKAKPTVDVSSAWEEVHAKQQAMGRC